MSQKEIRSLAWTFIVIISLGGEIMKRQNLLIVLLLVPCIWGYVAITDLGAVVDTDPGSALAAEQAENHYIDPVCNREVNRDTPHMREVDGKIYHFCSAACKRAFKKEIVEAPVVKVKMIYIDPVCGCRVSEDTPHIASYNDAMYHFCSTFSKNVFLSSPKEFSCFCAEGEHCPHRDAKVGKPCRKDRIPGYGLWSKWACPKHHTRFY
ncbi:MAG: YHS domain-containing protein [Candidatus Brocadiales bacterium]